MPKYTVLVREVHISHMTIETSTPEEALALVQGGGGCEEYSEYSHTMDSDHWTVENEKGVIVLG